MLHAALALLLQVGSATPASPSVKVDATDKGFSVAAANDTDRDRILAAVDDALNPVRECWGDELRSHPKMHGTLLVIFTVLPDGSVSRPVVSQDEIKNRMLSDCVSRHLGEMHVPIEDQTIRSVLPIVFSNGVAPAKKGDAVDGDDKKKKPGHGKPEPKNSEEAIDQVLEAKRDYLYTCYTKALKKDPDIQGSLTMAFSVEENGTVRSGTISNSTIHSRDLEDCFVTRFKSIRFPPPDSGRLTLQRDFDFQPGVKPGKKGSTGKSDLKPDSK
ncbi:MAG TPA: AgmX/PglI C-terminal domain-containing protein [bacterium]|nr:AgmX/PglI C-terminal domain-containing protein [bacterium]